MLSYHSYAIFAQDNLVNHNTVCLYLCYVNAANLNKTRVKKGWSRSKSNAPILSHLDHKYINAPLQAVRSQITLEMPQSSRSQWAGIAAFSAIILLLGLLYVSFKTDISESVRSYLPSTFRVSDDCIIPPFSPNQGSSSCVTTCYNASNTLLLGEGRDPHITKVVTHVHGFTVFENVYVRNGTFFVVHEDSVAGNSSQAEGFPPRRNIITKIVDYGPGVDFEPSDEVCAYRVPPCQPLIQIYRN